MAAKKQSRDTPVPLLEWIAAALGTIVAAAFLIVIGLSIGDEASEELPRLTAEVRRVVAGQGSHSVVIVVRNDADRTAKQVEVEGKMGDETSVVSLDYVAARSSAQGALIFKGDPRTTPVALRVTGYQLP